MCQTLQRLLARAVHRATAEGKCKGKVKGRSLQAEDSTAIEGWLACMTVDSCLTAAQVGFMNCLY